MKVQVSTPAASSNIEERALLIASGRLSARMKDPSLEQHLVLATIEDRDEGVDVCDSPAPNKIVTAVSPSRRQNKQVAAPKRNSKSRMTAAGRHQIATDVCETIPEETAAGGSSAENEETERRAAERRQQIVAAHRPPRRHRKLLPIQHLSLNIRQVIDMSIYTL